MKCKKCTQEIPANELDWDGLCQMCWEAYCSDEYWDWYNRTKGIFCNPHLGAE